MNLTKIAAQNLLRRKNRSIILILSVLIGVGSVLFLYLSSRAMTEDIANKLDQYGSNILILPEAGESLTFGGVTVDSPAKIQELSPELIPLMKTIKNNETLATIAPKLLANTTLNNYDVLLLGVDFTQELRLKKWWKIDGLNKRQIPKENQILLGTEVASRLNLQPLQEIEILGSKFSVAGIIQSTGSPEDDQAIFMNLPTLQKLTNKNTISLIEAAALCYTCPIEEVTQQLRDKLPGTRVTALKSSLESRDDTVQRFDMFAVTLSGILFLTTTIVVAMTMKASVEERTREIGILRAIGFRRRHVAQMIFTESIVLSIIGGIVGAVAGMGLAIRYAPLLVKMKVHIQWEPLSLLYATAISVWIGLVASSYPAWKAVRLNPADSMRFI